MSDQKDLLIESLRAELAECKLAWSHLKEKVADLRQRNMRRPAACGAYNCVENIILRLEKLKK